MKRLDEPFTFIVSREWGCTQLRGSPEQGANYMPKESSASIENLRWEWEGTLWHIAIYWQGW